MRSIAIRVIVSPSLVAAMFVSPKSTPNVVFASCSGGGKVTGCQQVEFAFTEYQIAFAFLRAKQFTWTLTVLRGNVHPIAHAPNADALLIGVPL
ncbi:MAG: hypothetical protein ABI700_06295 [Chloroflexota bacterium]